VATRVKSASGRLGSNRQGARYGLPGQHRHLGNIPIFIGGQHHVIFRQAGESRRELRLFLQRSIIERDALPQILGLAAVEQIAGLQVEVQRIGIVGPAHRRVARRRMRSPTCSSTARAVEISSSRAKTCAAGGSNALDQIWRPLCALYIRGDADSVSFKTYTTLQHQIDVQLPADPANVAASLEPLGRPARRHLQLSGAAPVGWRSARGGHR
jgi:hypothetical protein